MPGEGGGGFMILDEASCGVASLIHDDGSLQIRNRGLFLGSYCHSGTWFRVPETVPPWGPRWGEVGEGWGKGVWTWLAIGYTFTRLFNDTI